MKSPNLLFLGFWCSPALPFDSSLGLFPLSFCIPPFRGGNLDPLGPACSFRSFPNNPRGSGCGCDFGRAFALAIPCNSSACICCLYQSSISCLLPRKKSSCSSSVICATCESNRVLLISLGKYFTIRSMNNVQAHNPKASGTLFLVSNLHRYPTTFGSGKGLLMRFWRTE